MNEDKIIDKLLEHDQKFDSADENLSKFREEFLSGQDAMMTILKRLDEERIFTQKWVREIETKVEESSKEIQRLKIQLKVA